MSRPYGIQIVGDYAYVSVSPGFLDGDGGISIVNIADPLNPTIEGSTTSVTGQGGVRQLQVVGDYAYVPSLGDVSNLCVIDVTDKTNPVEVGCVVDSSALNQAFCVRVLGDYAYVGLRDTKTLTVVNIADPTNPTIVSSMSSNWYIDTLEIFDGEIYATQAYNTLGLAKLSLDDPTNPVEIDSVTLPQAPQGIAIKDGYVYVPSYNSHTVNQG